MQSGEEREEASLDGKWRLRGGKGSPLVTGHQPSIPTSVSGFSAEVTEQEEKAEWGRGRERCILIMIWIFPPESKILECFKYQSFCRKIRTNTSTNMEPTLLILIKQKHETWKFTIGAKKAKMVILTFFLCLTSLDLT